MARDLPIRRGIALAAVAALLFGATSPLLQRASVGMGPFTAGGLLYLGAALTSVMRWTGRGRGREAPLRRADLPRVAAMALLGAVLAPAALVAGLHRTDAASASLLLALEAPFTFILARLVYREHLGPRVLGAVALLFAGGVVLGGGRLGDAASLTGCLFVVLATALWAGDNTLSRVLADRDPVAVVGAKGALGAAAALGVAVLVDPRPPSAEAALALVAIGAVGYGTSLQIYLRAQRLVGAARTASVFAMAPLAGAAIALVLGAQAPQWPLAVASVLIVAGVWLHASEHHGHRHHHAALEHEHVHRHDDGHHQHPHLPATTGPHSHPHRHEPLEHEHEHGEDLHHLHPH